MRDTPLGSLRFSFSRLSLLTGLASALLFPAAAFAEAPTGTMTPEAWYIDTEVTINGTNLHGSMPSQDKLCFAPEVDPTNLICFQAGHANILYWTSGILRFIPPKNAPPLGLVVLSLPVNEQQCSTVYNQSSCQTVTVKNRYTIGTYSATPHISDVIDVTSGERALSLKEGRLYEIRGYRFGSSPMYFYANGSSANADIDAWSFESIRFHATADLAQAKDLQVFNGAARSNVWQLTTTAGSTADKRTRVRGGLLPLSRSGALHGSGSVTITGTGSVTESGAVTPTESTETTDVWESPFRDIKAEDAYAEAILWAAEHGIVEGYNDGTFRPFRSVTRAELLKMMITADPSLNMDAYGSLPSTFWDVNHRAWYGPYVAYAQTADIVQGYSNGTFRPGFSVNGAEALKMLYRFFAVPTLDPKGRMWYDRYLEHARAKRVLPSAGLDPRKDLNRADAIWIIWKLQDYAERYNR